MERCPQWNKLLAIAILGAFFAAGCAALKESKPILPIKEYEKMIVGRLDADYIGTDNCLRACHAHDKIRRDFDLSTMGAQLSRESGLPLVNCESCHGPGSLAVEPLTPEKLAADAKAGKVSTCDFKTFIDIKNIPAQARSLICLKCHTANATFNLHNWNASTHSTSDVSCSDCHDPHGSGSAEKMLRRDTVKATCTQCHPEKEGPFAFEHADLMDDCRNCHTPHGSVNNNLLIQREPFLCLQCHPSHPISNTTTAEQKRAFYTRCTDCHSQIHGSDLPSTSGKGNLTK